MAGSGFRVDPAKLTAVADQVANLRADLAGRAAGNVNQYQTQTSAATLTAALASFWDGSDVFASAYNTEQSGVVTTMEAMISQLTELEKACRSTAEQYSAQDSSARTTVRRSDGATA